VTAYAAELQVTTHFSFLRGASSAEELFAAAAILGLPALGVADRGSVAGIVRCWEAAKTTGVRLIAGARVHLTDGPPLLLYPTDRAAWSRLTRLLSVGKTRAGKGGCELAWDDVAAWSEGLVAVMLTPFQSSPSSAWGGGPPAEGGWWRRRDGSAGAPGPTSHRSAALRGPSAPSGHLPKRSLGSDLATLRDIFAGRAYAALTLHRRPRDRERLARLDAAARAADVRSVATGDVLYHSPDRQMLQDVMTCIREGCTIDELGFRRERTADRHLIAAAEMERRFAWAPHALAATGEIAERVRFDLSQLQYQYPEEREAGLSAQETLERLTWEGADWRYKGEVPPEVTAQLRHELKLIAELDYAPYFLTVHNIVRFARRQNILCQGRGSAANSAVCYVLAITSIDPVSSGLLFERFVSNARREPPDIDVDFEHERREEVIQWIYNTYGRDQAALTSTVVRYRARGAVREVGKALGLSEDVTGALAGQVWGWSTEGVAERHAADLNLNTADRRLQLTLDLARQLIGTPRHLSQHPGGFVLTQDRLDELVPIEPASMPDRQVIEWDKDDIDALRFMKVDVLGLGMLGCMRRAFNLLEEHKPEVHEEVFDLATVPPEDPRTFAMIQKADTLGTFQIESRAQMSMLPRLKPSRFYDLVIEVAIVRPGPIQGDMVHPYLRRREGKEPVEYPTPELKAVLEKTLGVPLFQEQAMQVAIVAAGFTPTEADQLRRSMATFQLTGGVSRFHDKLVLGMVRNGYTEEFAAKTFKQIEGFGSYGFPESHAASFALIAYASSWMKCWHPDVFCCALLNAQPMGFYAPAQIVRDAIEHGVEVRPVDVNLSDWDSTLERSPEGGRRHPITAQPTHAVRMGLRTAKGLSEAHALAIVVAREDGPFTCIETLWRRAGVPPHALERIAEADGFGSLGLTRREALWHVRALADEPLPLFAAADRAEGRARPEAVEPAPALKPMTEGAEVVADYRSKGLTLRAHPVSFLRDSLARDRMVPCAALADIRDGRPVRLAGIVLVRQKPGSAKGVMFVTIEDETGIANLVVWPSLFEQQRRLILSATMLGVIGRVQRDGEVIHVVVQRLIDYADLLRSVGGRDTLPALTGPGDAPTRGGFDARTDGLPVPSARGDEAKGGGGPDPREKPTVRPRDIYHAPFRHGPRAEIEPKTRDFR
jgi:error-prone DNA polymerase